MELVFIDVEHALYPAECALRYAVLREPLGLPETSTAFPFERESLHLVALDDDRHVLGCVLFHPESEHTGRLFQMAVSPSSQRAGIGARLVRALESELVARGFTEVAMHARESARGFYERLGYEVFGEPFVEVSVPHRHMRRRIAP